MCSRNKDGTYVTGMQIENICRELLDCVTGQDKSEVMTLEKQTTHGFQHSINVDKTSSTGNIRPVVQIINWLMV